MGTRSLIGVETDDNCIEYVYCHFDGYPSYNGVILFENYKDEETARELISHGGMSSLGKKIHPDPSKPHSYDRRQEDVTVFYHRDRGESLVIDKGSEFKFLQAFKDGWTEYAYLRRRDGTWQAMNKYAIDTNYIWFDLDDVLNKGAWDFDEDE